MKVTRAWGALYRKHNEAELAAIMQAHLALPLDERPKDTDNVTMAWWTHRLDRIERETGTRPLGYHEGYSGRKSKRRR